MMIPNLFRKKVEKSPENPYVTGNPVIGTFVGRQDILKAVRGVLNSSHKNAITLFGQRRIGKTSVLKKLEVDLSTLTSTGVESTKYVPVYFDLMYETHYTLETIIDRLVSAICRKLLEKEPQWQNPRDQFFVWLVELLQKNRDKILVILFDEFDSLDDAKSEQIRDEFFRYLNELLSIDMKRLNIVFTIGRNIDDFKTAQALFKGIENYRISLLNQDSTEQLIHLSAQNNSLYWSRKAIQRVWQLTNGHPYLTQLLCSLIWDRYWNEKNSEAIPRVTMSDVEDSAQQVLNDQQAGQNALEWLWSGLPPACRIDAAAFAELGAKHISHKEFVDHMYDAGIGTVIEELENAPKDLRDWDIIEGDKQSGYRFRVELFRQWVKENKPLKSIMQDELGRIRVEAEQYYQTATEYYQSEKYDEAISKLDSALRINAHFIEAHKLLAKALIAKGELLEAQEKLEKFYQSFPDQARPQLVELLWNRVESSGSRNERLDLCEQILRLDSGHANADRKRKDILSSMAEELEDDGDYSKARKLYSEINSDDSKKKVKELQHKIFWKKWGKWISGAVVLLVVSVFFGFLSYFSQQWWGWSVTIGTISGIFAVFLSGKILSKRQQELQRF
jgi:tetratricopeptide (TPR) repeat protein